MIVVHSLATEKQQLVSGKREAISAFEQHKLIHIFVVQT